MKYFYFIFHRAYLIFFLWYKHFFRIAAASIAFLVTLSLVTLFLGIIRPAKDFFAHKLQGSLPGEIIKVKPRDMSKYSNPLVLFQEKPDVQLGVTLKDIGRIQSWKGTSQVYYSQMMQRPVLAHLKHPFLSSLGGGLKFDVLIQGVHPKLAKSYLFCMKDFRPRKRYDPKLKKTEIIIPMVVPDIYISIAQIWLSINRLPMVNMRSLNGLNLDLTIGKSLVFKGSSDSLKLTGKICGYVPEGIVSTLGVPIKWVRNHHYSNNMRNAANSYDQVFVKVKNPKNISRIKGRLKKMGLSGVSDTRSYNQFSKWVKNIDYIFWISALILLILSGISLVNSFTLLAVEKKYEFGLYLVLGASPVFIPVLMFLEGALWGFIHSILSLGLADICFDYLKTNLSIIKNYPELAQIKFSLSGTEKLFMILFAVLFSGLSSMLPTVLLMYNKTVELIKKD